MITYEWVVETLDYYQDALGDSDIIDTCAFPSYNKALNAALNCDEKYWQIALRRDVGNDVDGLTDRLYAYPASDGQLPEYFDDSNVKIPQIYRDINIHYGIHPTEKEREL